MDQEQQPASPRKAAHTVRGICLRATLALTGVFGFGGVQGASAQDAPGEPQDTTVYSVDPVIVTATRGPRLISETPRPALVLQPRDISDNLPNTVSDLFRTQPGLDVTGVGISQVRPQIRGQRGQRILTLTDGLRMNNTRRENDFGEPLALVDIGAVDHVEVVRGPASVLYGSDAIGGVVNILTRVPTEEGFGGSASYLFGSAGDQSRVMGRVEGRSGSFSFIGGGSWRTADAYVAPKGKFGNISMPQDAKVLNTGAEDYNLDARVGWDFSSRVGVFGKVERYNSDGSGFGFLPPEAYAPGLEEIDITYPSQTFTKFTAGVEAQDLDFVLADRFNVTAYGQGNERKLFFDAVFPTNPPDGPPGSFVAIASHNFTDIGTSGVRLEARKLVTSGVLLTYGFDGFRDDAKGTDADTTTLSGYAPGPPMVFTDDTPSLPDAHFLSLGAFVQGEIDLGDRLSVVAGGRFQDVTAESFRTDGLDVDPAKKDHNALVGALNLMYEATDELSVIASAGRGFRSPNLVELFFEGAVPEDGAYQLAAQGLKAETSFNVDLGFRYLSGPLFLEAFAFRNKIYDGVRSRPVLDSAGDTIQTGPYNTYQWVNIDEILLRGFELNGDYRFDVGVGLGGSYSYVDAKDEIDPDNPVGEGYSSKFAGYVAYRDPAGRYWTQFETRHSGRQDEAEIAPGNPIGDAIPAYTVLNVRGGVRLPEVNGMIQSITVAVNNLTNELYAESANASFFRPEPGRSVSVSLNVAF